ncbi:MAG: hypothetical protein HPY73_08130 [Methanomassiliicoccales archaeon]|nr:MAG: hypothetical protein HPY73_08130 [Methanomassiliicoccales archaeon]
MQIEYGLGVIVPSMLSLMMFSYVLFEPLFPVFLFVGILAAASMLFPAKKIHELGYKCWSRDVVSRAIITSMLGIIYITEVSVFAVSMLSIYEGLDPEKPLTFAVFATLVILLIVVLAYNDRMKESFDRTHRRSVRMNADSARSKVVEILSGKGHPVIEKDVNGKKLLYLPEQRISIHVRQMGVSDAELFVKVDKDGDLALTANLRDQLSFD